MNAIDRTFQTGPAMNGCYAALTDPNILTLRRRLPGPVERVWAHLTESDLRRTWLAAGDMVLEAGAAFDLTWRNDDLTDPPGRRPDGFPGVHTNRNRIVAAVPNRRLSFAFGEFGEVTFDLEFEGNSVLLTLVHRGVADRAILVSIIAPSWHNHLDLLVARMEGRTPDEPYWDKMARLQADYGQELRG